MGWCSAGSGGNPQQKQNKEKDNNVEPLIIRIGSWGLLYSNYNKELPKIVLVIIKAAVLTQPQQKDPELQPRFEAQINTGSNPGSTQV